jgi:predicted enzyme related to lactoylglutathione lyase
MWNSYVHVSDAEKAVGRAQAAGGTVVIPPTELLGLGSLAFVTDREGAVVGLWQAGTHHGATRVNRPGSLCWNELNTSDLTDAKTFYGRLFGWSYRTNPDFPSPYSTIENERRENGGMMEMTDEWDDLPPHWSVYFAVENIERSMQRLEQLDGRVHTGPFNTEHGPMAVVEDPQGATFNLIELSEERR